MTLFHHIERITSERRHKVTLSTTRFSSPSTPNSNTASPSHLRGKIIHLHTPTTADVELPMGTVTARIEGMIPILHTDLLLTIVHPKPELQLKISGIISTASLSTREILQAFGLPTATRYERLASTLRKHRIFLLRQELEDLFRFFDYLQQLPPAQRLSTHDVLQLYQLLTNLHLPITESIVQSLLPLLQLPLRELYHFLPLYANLLRMSDHQLRSNTSEKEAPLLRLIPLSDLLRYPNPNSPPIDSSESPSSPPTQTLKQFIASEILYNLLAWVRGFPLQWTGILQIAGRQLPIRLTFDRRRDTQQSPSLTFTLECHTTTLDTIYVEGRIQQRAISVQIWCSTPQCLNRVTDTTTQLQYQLRSVGFQHIHIRTGLLEERSSPLPPPSLNIVL